MTEREFKQSIDAAVCQHREEVAMTDRLLDGIAQERNPAAEALVKEVLALKGINDLPTANQRAAALLQINRAVLIAFLREALFLSGSADYTARIKTDVLPAYVEYMEMLCGLAQSLYADEVVKIQSLTAFV